MSPLSQANRPLKATTPLGADVLVPVGFSGTEALSTPFLFTVDFVSEDPAIKATDLLGQGITLQLERTDGEIRYFHGMVRRFTHLGTQAYQSLYRAELVPKLWFLTLSEDCRTFEQKSVIDIVKQLCSDAGVSDIAIRVAATPAAIPYVVQYRESNFAFVSRLLEDAGLYYTFEHADGKHTFVVSDASAGSIPPGAVATVTVNATEMGELALAERIFECRREFAMHTGKVEVLDHDLLRPNNTATVTGSGAQALGARFDFVGDLGPAKSQDIAKVRIEGEEVGFDTVHGRSNVGSFTAGTRVTFTDAPGGDGEFLLVSVSHDMQVGDVVAGGELEARYENAFVAVPHDIKYRPPQVTPRPSVRGSQTAIIVGSGGKGAIDVDKEGRVLLEFPWDRGAGKDGKSKFRVHVAHLWAGGGWGFVQLPRVGQEVLVEFLEGEVDRPLVTGRVYNSSLKHPYSLPDNKTQSGWKSQTLDGGADNFNEIRFDDKKGSEHIYVQAEKDLETKVKNDEKRDVLNDRTTTIKNNDTRTVQEGNDTHTVEKGNQSVEVSKGDQTIKVATGKQTITVKDDQSTTIQSGNRSVTIQQGNDTLGVKLGNISIKADAGSITVQAMQKIELKVGGNSIVIDMTGVTIKGTMVKIEAQAMAEMKSPMTKVEGSGMMQVKGAMTQVNGDGMLMAKGGITMIN